MLSYSVTFEGFSENDGYFSCRKTRYPQIILIYMYQITHLHVKENIRTRLFALSTHEQKRMIQEACILFALDFLPLILGLILTVSQICLKNVDFYEILLRNRKKSQNKIKNTLILTFDFLLLMVYTIKCLIFYPISCRKPRTEDYLALFNQVYTIITYYCFDLLLKGTVKTSN